MKRKGLRKQLALWLYANSPTVTEKVDHYLSVANNNRTSLMHFGIRKKTPIERSDILAAIIVMREDRIAEMNGSEVYDQTPLEDRFERILDKLHKRGYIN